MRQRINRTIDSPPGLAQCGAKLVRINELCLVLGPSVTVRMIHSWIALRKVPYYKIGRRTLLFDVSEVRAALQQFRVEAIATPNIRGAGKTRGH